MAFFPYLKPRLWKILRVEANDILESFNLSLPASVEMRAAT